jgi:hypothetical protein
MVYLEYVISLAVQYHHTLVEVVMFHCAGGVQYGERRLRLGLKGVVGTPVIQVVTQTCHKQTKDLQHS